MEVHNGKTIAVEHVAPLGHEAKGVPSSDFSPVHPQPEVTDMTTADEIEEGKKGWFAYLRTRNFYIVLLLGYGPSHPNHGIHADNHVQTSAGAVYYFYKYLLFAASSATFFDTCIPITLELHSPEHSLYFVYPLSIRLEEIHTRNSARWLEIPYSCFLGR